MARRTSSLASRRTSSLAFRRTSSIAQLSNLVKRNSVQRTTGPGDFPKLKEAVLEHATQLETAREEKDAQQKLLEASHAALQQAHDAEEESQAQLDEVLSQKNLEGDNFNTIALQVKKGKLERKVESSFKKSQQAQTTMKQAKSSLDVAHAKEWYHQASLEEAQKKLDTFVAIAAAEAALMAMSAFRAALIAEKEAQNCSFYGMHQLNESGNTALLPHQHHDDHLEFHIGGTIAGRPREIEEGEQCFAEKLWRQTSKKNMVGDKLGHFTDPYKFIFCHLTIFPVQFHGFVNDPPPPPVFPDPPIKPTSPEGYVPSTAPRRRMTHEIAQQNAMEAQYKSDLALYEEQLAEYKETLTRIAAQAGEALAFDPALIEEFYPLEDLQPPHIGLDDSVNVHHLEMYLSAGDFKEIFVMTKREFQLLPTWKQVSLKHEQNLYT